MRKRRLSMSQVVLNRKRQRREKRIRLATWTVTMSIIVGVQILTYHFNKQRVIETKKITMLVKQRVAEADAPTWADFQAAKGVHETQEYAGIDGVPFHITINGELWSIVHVNNFNSDSHHKYGEYFSGTGGETFCENKTIAYDSSADARLLKINIMHEIFHAGDCLHGGDTWWNSEHPTRTDHPGVYHLGEFMATFLHDNPQFAMWEAE